MRCKECAEYENCYAGQHGKGKEKCSMFSPCALSVEKKIADMRISFARDYVEKHCEKFIAEEYGDDDFLSIYSMLLIQEEIKKKVIDKTK